MNFLPIVAKAVFLSATTCALLIGTAAMAQNSKLSPEGLQRQSAHEFLFGQFAKRHPSTFKGKGKDRVLEEIILDTKRIESDGELVIELPEGSQRIAGMFRYFLMRGENLDRIGGLKLLPYAPDGHMHVSTKRANLYRVQLPALPVPSESMEPMRIVAQCSGDVVIKEIAFNSQGRLKTTFDDIPFRNLGGDRPREEIEIRIDTQRELSIEGHVDLNRAKFFRYYALPGMPHPSLEKWAAERNFLPGRQINKLQYSLVKGYSPKQPKLKEDAKRPGHADLSFFEKYNSGFNPASTIPHFRDIPYALCFDNYPDFMSVSQVGRGTPKVEHFDAAAELVAAFIADGLNESGRTAPFYEVKNESTIKAEWDYHYLKQHDSWALLADLHGKIADAVHEKAPGAKVGGPSSAWMQLQVGDFGLYENQRKFIDLTKGKLDFYSHHFYENTGTIGAWERRKDDYTGYLLGSMESMLDMLHAHMTGINNVRPILITECGSLQAGRGPSDYWLRLRSFSAYMHKLSARPHQIEMAVPFVFLNIPWSPQSGNAAFIPKENKPPNGPIEEYDTTPVKNFFELWRDFDGRRLPVRFKRPYLDITALHKGNRIFVALTNMGGRRLKVNLNTITGKAIESNAVTQKRMYFLDGEVVYDDRVSYPDPSGILVDVEESTVVTIELPKPLEIESQQNRRFFYAPETAVKSDQIKQTTFEINIDDPGTVTRAILKVGLHRVCGLKRKLQGTFNGKAFRLDVDWAGDVNHLFATIDVPVPLNLIRANNIVTIKPIQGMTVTAVHVQTDSKKQPNTGVRGDQNKR